MCFLQVLLEQNQINQTEEMNYTFVYGAYDVDIPSTLTIVIEGPSNGILEQGSEMTSMPNCTSSTTIQVCVCVWCVFVVCVFGLRL